MIMRSASILLFCLFLAQPVVAQNLLEERIRKVTTRKRSVFLDSGIFHNGTAKVKSQLKAIRHSFSKSQGYERLVFDFVSDEVPRIYGHIAGKEKKIYIDFFNTKMIDNVGSFGNSKFVESINFFPLSRDSLSVEVQFKKSVTVDLFYLKSPGRFVVDIKG